MQKPFRLVQSYHKTVFILGFVSCLCLTACGNKNTNQTNTKSQNAQTTTQSNQSNSQTPNTKIQIHQNTNQKLNDYIQCANFGLSSIYHGYDRYTGWVQNLAIGPTGKEMVVYGIDKIDNQDIGRCTTKISQASSMTPTFDELDKSAIHLATTFKLYADTVAKAHTYYKQQNYKDDNFTMGKSLHQEILKNYASFQKDADTFEKALALVIADTQKQILDDLATKTGQNDAYWSLDTAIKAKAVVDLFSNQTFDTQTASVLLDELEKSATELKTHLDDNNNTPENISDKLDEFISASKKRLRRVRNNQAYTDQEQQTLAMNQNIAMTVDGSIAQLVYTYNAFIQKYNTSS